MPFSLDPVRFYLAAISTLGLGILARANHHVQATTSSYIVGLTADLMILLAFALIIRGIFFLLPTGPLNSSIHNSSHVMVAVFVGFAAMASSIHFIKTGEILDLRMAAFFFQHAHELGEIAVLSMDSGTTHILATFMLILLLAAFQIRHRVSKRIQYFTLSLPMLLLALNVGYEKSSPESSFQPLVFEKDKPDYNVGVFKDLREQQMAWLHRYSNEQWQSGVLSGLLFASTSGTSLFRVLTDKQPALPVYGKPAIDPSPLAAGRRPSAKKNVVIITLESTRATAIGAYAPSGASTETPFFDGLAERGWLVERAYTTISHTSKALVGIFCGTFAQFTVKNVESKVGDFPLACLPSLLAQAGYATSHFQTAPGDFENRPALLSNLGITHHVTRESFPDDTPRYGYFALDDRVLIRPMVTWMQEQQRAGKPYLVSMLTTLTHHPYLFPGYVSVLDDPDSARTAYLKSVTYNDGTLRKLFDAMKAAGLTKNTLFVITGDHGQGFGEHGQFVHNGVGYEEGVRVPLLLYDEDLPSQGRRLLGLRQHIDIMPTVLDHLGLSYTGQLPGKNLWTDPDGHDQIITSCFYEFYCLGLIRASARKTLYFFEKRPLEHFDLNADPQEAKSLASNAMSDAYLGDLEVMTSMRKSYAAVFRGFAPLPEQAH